MKKLFLIVLLFVIGCGYSGTKVTESNRLQVEGAMTDLQISEFEYKGCEYIAFGMGNSLTITHKGNCKYCAKKK